MVANQSNMNNENYAYVIWQCVMVLVCGITGLAAVYIRGNLSQDISILFALVFILCIITALFFLVWVRHQRKQDEEDRLIDSIGKND